MKQKKNKGVTIPQELFRIKWTHKDLFSAIVMQADNPINIPTENAVRYWATGKYFPSTHYIRIVEKVLGTEVVPCNH